MHNNKVKIVILAAGKGTRMQSEKPKALAELNGMPMISHLLEAVLAAGFSKPIIVIGHGAEMVQSILGNSFEYVIQEEPLGTAHALLSAQNACADAKHIVVLYGDHPFVSSNTIKKLLAKSEEMEAEITLASTEVPNFENEYKVFSNFARIMRHNGKIAGIREAKDASGEERNIKEVNPGYYVFDSKWLWSNLKKIKNENARGEYYLTNLIGIASKNGNKTESIKIELREAMGANSKKELEILEKFVVQ